MSREPFSTGHRETCDGIYPPASPDIEAICAFMPPGEPPISPEFPLSKMFTDCTSGKMITYWVMKVLLTLKACFERIKRLEEAVMVAAGDHRELESQCQRHVWAAERREEKLARVFKAAGVDVPTVLGAGEPDAMVVAARDLAEKMAESLRTPQRGADDFAAQSALESIFDLLKLPNSTIPRTESGRVDAMRIASLVTTVNSAYISCLKEREDLRVENAELRLQLNLPPPEDFILQGRPVAPATDDDTQPRDPNLTLKMRKR